MASTARIVRKTAADVAFTDNVAAGSTTKLKAVGLVGDTTITVEAMTSTTSGAHDGSSGAAVLTDSGESWVINQWVGYSLVNFTDGSSTTVTSNTATTITGVLAGGTDDDWDAADNYTIIGYHTLTERDGSGHDVALQLTERRNTIEIVGPLDYRLNKPVTTAAVGVDEYS